MFRKYSALKTAPVEQLPDLDKIYSKALLLGDPIEAIKTIRDALTVIGSTNKITDSNLKEKIADLLFDHALEAEKKQLYLHAFLGCCDVLLLLDPNCQSSNECGEKISSLAILLKDDGIRGKQQILPDIDQINAHLNLTLSAWRNLQEGNPASFVRIISGEIVKKSDMASKPVRKDESVINIFKFFR